MEKNDKYPVRKKSGTFFVKEPPNFYEANLCSLWASLPEKSVLELENGKKAILLSPGKANTGEGPDFLGAKILFGKCMKEGDISIHCRVSDFIRHGHVADPAYDHVILQAAKLNDLKSTPPRKMEKLPVFLMDEAKINAIRKNFSASPLPPEIKKEAKAIKEIKEKFSEKRAEKKIIIPDKEVERLVPCLSALSPEEEKQFFLQAAKRAMEEKREQILQKIIACGTESAFKELLFQFAGNSRNEKAFASLFVTYSHYPVESRKKHFQSILWGESGLLPDPLSMGKEDGESIVYVKKMWENFWQNRTGNKLSPQWNHSGSLYGNTPERSLALLCHLLEKLPFDPLGVLAEKLCVLGAEKFREFLTAQLEISDPFWEYRNHFHTGKKEQKRTLFSSSRLILFFTDVLIPALFAYAKLYKDLTLLHEMEKLFLLLPAPCENSLIRKSSVFWYGAEKNPCSAAEYLGWLYIYRNYCSRLSHDCASCVLSH